MKSSTKKVRFGRKGHDSESATESRHQDSLKSLIDEFFDNKQAEIEVPIEEYKKSRNAKVRTSQSGSVKTLKETEADRERIRKLEQKRIAQLRKSQLLLQHIENDQA